MAAAKGLLGAYADKGGSALPSGGKSPAAAPMSDPKTMAAEDMIEAMESGDAAGLAAAFQRMYDACAMKKGGDAAEDLDLELE